MFYWILIVLIVFGLSVWGLVDYSVKTKTENDVFQVAACVLGLLGSLVLGVYQFANIKTASKEAIRAVQNKA